MPIDYSLSNQLAYAHKELQNQFRRLLDALPADTETYGGYEIVNGEHHYNYLGYRFRIESRLVRDGNSPTSMEIALVYAVNEQRRIVGRWYLSPRGTFCSDSSLTDRSQLWHLTDMFDRSQILSEFAGAVVESGVLEP